MKGKGIRFIQNQQIKSTRVTVELMRSAHHQRATEILSMAFAHDTDFDSGKGVPKTNREL